MTYKQNQPRNPKNGRWVKAINRSLMKTQTVKRMRTAQKQANRIHFNSQFGHYPDPKPVHRRRRTPQVVPRKRIFWIF